MALSEKTREIYPAFGKFAKTGDKSLIKHFTLKELKHANYDLGRRDENSAYRLAIKDRIKTLEERRNIWRFIIPIGVLIAVVGGYILDILL